MASLRRYGALPGFGLAMGYTLVYLSLVVLIPLSAVAAKTVGMGWEAFWAAVSNPQGGFLPVELRAIRVFQKDQLAA